MSKQLSVIVQAVDQATGPLTAITGRVNTLGQAAVRQSSTLGSAMRALTSVINPVTAAIGGLVAGLSAFGAARLFHQTAMAMDDIGDASEKLGISVTRLSELRYAAERTDMSFESLADGYSKALRRIGEAAQGTNKDVIESLKQLNVSLRQGGQLKPFEDIMDDLVGKLSGMGQYQQAVLVEKLFGKSGSDFIRFVKMGKDNMALLNEEARKLGVVFTPESIAAAGAYEQAIIRLKNAWFGLRAGVVEALGPMVADVMDQLASLTAAVPDIVKSLKGSIGRAMGGTMDDAERARFDALFTSLSTLVKDGVAGLLEVGATVLVHGIPAIGRLLGPTFDLLWYTLLDAPVSTVLATVTDTFFTAIKGMARGAQGLLPGNQTLGLMMDQAVAKVNDLQAGMREVFSLEKNLARGAALQTAADGAVAAVGALRPAVEAAADVARRRFTQMAGEFRTFVAAADAALNGALGAHSVGQTPFSSMAEGVGELRDELSLIYPEIRAVFGPAGSYRTATDGMVESTLSWAAAQDEVNAAIGELQGYRDTFVDFSMLPTEATEAVRGYKAALGEMWGESQDTFTQVKDLTRGVFTSLSSGMADAVVDFVSGTKSMGAAFRDFAGQTLREISTMIMRMLIFRALSSAFGSFAGATPVNSGLNSLTGEAAGAGMSGGFGPGFGITGIGGIPGQASGGWARSTGPVMPDGGRLHNLHPPEYVLSARGSLANAGVLEYMNKGGRVAPVGGGGGGGTTVNVYNQISGGASFDESMLRMLEDRTVAAVQKGLRTRPDFRAEVRGA